MNTFRDKITSVRNSWMILSLGYGFQDSASFQDRNVPIFQKYFTVRTLLEIRIGATVRRTLVELAKCKWIPLVFRIESLIFDDSEFWVEPIALDRFRKVHGFASSLLFPSLFPSYCFGIETVGSGFYEFSILNEIVDICAESRFWKKFN